MISSRFVPAVCALVAIALVPTYIHSYARSTVPDGRTTGSISESLAQYRGTASGRNVTWGKRRFDSDDWVERIYRSSNDEVKLSVIRSYDPKSLYHHPELAVSYGPSYVTTEVTRLSQRPDIPVHVRSTAGSDRTVALYALHYGDSFVQDPIRFQLRTAVELLFSGRKPMTLFFLTDESVPAGVEVDALPSIGLFLEAIEQFVASGRPTQ
jgi:hypothetical protein